MMFIHLRNLIVFLVWTMHIHLRNLIVFLVWTMHIHLRNLIVFFVWTMYIHLKNLIVFLLIPFSFLFFSFFFKGKETEIDKQNTQIAE